MECNKDEAIRAKEIAEKKFRLKDAVGAKKFALKAQNLYPELDGVQQMISTLDVLIASEHKVNGECDWYRILGVDPRADDQTVRKHYRKIALSLHPDKNKSVGADEAFKLISQAWSLLSDQVKRTTYDQKRNIKTSQEVPAPSGSGSPAPPQANGFHNSNNNSSSSKRTHKGNGHSGQHSHRQKSNTFWTVCHRCKTQYEYLRVYLNHNLLCPNCHKVFYAIEIAPPTSNVHRTKHHHSHQSQTAHQTNINWGPSSGGGSSSAANAFQQAYTKVKRNREEGQVAMKREEAMRRKISPASASKRKVSVNEMTISSQKKVSSSTGTETSVAGAANSTTFKQGLTEIGGTFGIPDIGSMRESVEPDIKGIILQKARTEIRNNLNVRKSSIVEEAATQGDQNGDESANGNNSVEPMNMDNSKSYTTKSFWDVCIDVPDPDFHDFYKDRSEKSFAENQVWAIYDDADGMPRRYALIRNIISCDPFKVQISWLIPRTSNQCGLLNWVTSGFLVTCGDFTVGRCEMSNTLNSFSHKVRWTDGLNGVIRILPRKGDVWALYKNWAPDWNELTESQEIHKYDLVEVLEDYDEVLGVTIVPLIKVAGFRSIFHHHLDFREVRQIPREQMSRFSHYVPSFLHRGQEAPSAPKGCKELDPAATPEELLHVVEYAKEDILNSGEDV